MELRKILEYLADKIEATLVAQHCPGKIVGGTVGPGGVSFVLQPMPSITFEQIQAALTIPMRRGREGIVLMLANNRPILEVGYEEN